MGRTTKGGGEGTSLFIVFRLGNKKAGQTSLDNNLTFYVIDWRLCLAIFSKKLIVRACVQLYPNDGWSIERREDFTLNCSIKNVKWRAQWHEICGTSNLRGKPSIPSFLRKLRILKAWDFKSWENYKWLGLLRESFWVWKTNIYPLSDFWESLCPCEAYCNILPLKNPLALQEKEKM